MILSENQRLLLGMGIKKGLLYYEDFVNVYANKGSAFSSAQSLIAKGYIELYSKNSSGIFRVIKAPEEAKHDN